MPTDHVLFGAKDPIPPEVLEWLRVQLPSTMWGPDSAVLINLDSAYGPMSVFVGLGDSYHTITRLAHNMILAPNQQPVVQAPATNAKTQAQKAMRWATWSMILAGASILLCLLGFLHDFARP